MESSDATLKDIERTYGKNVAMALKKYCSIYKLDVDDVVSDMTEDYNGLTPWDRFDRWAKRTLKIDVMGNFDDTIDWTGAEDERKRGRKKGRFGKVYSAPTDFSTMAESKDDADVGYEMNSLTNNFLEKIGDYLKTDCGITGNIEKYKFGPKIFFEHRGLGFSVEVKCCGKTED